MFKFFRLVLVFSTLVSVSAALAQNRVVVVPLGGDEALDHKVIFKTTSVYDGDLDGPTGADSKCASEAEGVGSKVSGRTFRAWVSGDLASDFQNLDRVMHRSTLPYTLVDGTLLADDYADLTDGTIANVINLDATGAASPRDSFVWTGLSNFGQFGISNCSNWSSNNMSISGDVGQSTTNLWSATGASSCSNEYHLYCIEQ